MRLIRYFVYFLIFLMVLLVGLFFAAPYLVDKEQIRSQIAQRSQETLGRELHIQGDLNFSTFPSLSVDLSDVSLANAAGFEPQNMANMKALRVDLTLLPLLFGLVELD